MKKDIDILLNKYFQAKTTLEEENELMRYFNSEEISGEDLIYHNLFSALAEEKNLKMDSEKMQSPAKKSKKGILKFILYPGVAAVILLFAFILFHREYDNSYVKIDGKKIKQPEIIEQYTSVKFKKISLLLSGCLNPVENVYEAKKAVELGKETLENVKGTINNVFENLPFKIIQNEKNDDSGRVLPIDSFDDERTNA